MKTNELRIGNYVHAEHETLEDAFKGDWIVCGVHEGGITIVSGHILADCQIHPIPLTEEVIYNFDAKFNTEKRCYELGPISFFITTKTVMCYVHGIRCYVCENVHQLQNLYFALTGEELKIII